MHASVQAQQFDCLSKISFTKLRHHQKVSCIAVPIRSVSWYVDKKKSKTYFLFYGKENNKSNIQSTFAENETCLNITGEIETWKS